MVTVMGSSVDSIVRISVGLLESLVLADSIVSWVCDCVSVDSGDVSTPVDSIEVGELVAVELILVVKLVVTEWVVVGESIVVELTELTVELQFGVNNAEVVSTFPVADDTSKVKHS